MRILCLTLLLAGCTSNHLYGPGDALDSSTSLKVTSLYNYERFTNPEIQIVVVDQLPINCNGEPAQGCAHVTQTLCTIEVGPYASPTTIAHEQRHCHGWSHHPKFANAWYPTQDG